MNSDEWQKFVTLLVEKPGFGRFEQVLRHSVPEQNGGVFSLRVPGGLFYNMLPKQKISEEISAHCQASEVRISPDEELSNKLIGMLRSGEILQAQPQAELPSEPAAQSSNNRRIKYFSLEDHLSEGFRQDRNAYLVTPANGMAYRDIKRAIEAFPSLPDNKPFMLTAGIGMGKTHLLQHFAWQLVEKIKLAQDILERNAFDEGRKLLNLFDDEQDSSVRQLLNQAAKSRVRYVTGEEFVEEHILSTNKDAWKDRKGSSDEYKREREHWYSTIDWLFWDDIHAFARGEKKSSLEYAYKVADRFYRSGCFLVAATDTLPKLLIENAEKGTKQAVERLFSRFYSGGMRFIEAPAKEELAEVLNHHLAAHKLKEISAEELKKGSFYTAAKSYRDALSVANTALAYVQEGLPLESAIKKGIDALKTQKSASGDLFGS
jgi:chromosomal replication initiation ATPase DnaA